MVRLLALGLAAWVAFYGWVYIVSMRDQGSTPYWWYLAIIGAGAVLPLLTAAVLRSRFLLICDVVVLGVAAVLALPSQGMLLLPGVVAAAVMAGRTTPRKARVRWREEPVMPEPRDEMPAALGHDHLRACHADREEVIGVLKAAFVQG